MINPTLHTVNEGGFTLSDGRHFVCFNVPGDGFYSDNVGRTYMVDSGSIGLMKIEDSEDAPRGAHFRF